MIQAPQPGAVGTIPARAFTTYPGSGETAAAAARKREACRPRLNLAVRVYTKAATTADREKKGTWTSGGKRKRLPASRSAAAHVADTRRLRVCDALANRDRAPQ